MMTLVFILIQKINFRNKKEINQQQKEREIFKMIMI